MREVLTRHDQEPRRAAGRIADHVGRRRYGQLHHQFDDVTRRSELPVLTGRRDLAEHVFVQVALGVAVLHRHLVDHVDDLGQQRRRRDREPSVFHVLGVRRPVTTECSQEWKDVVADDLEHLLGFKVFEPGPAQIVERAFFLVSSRREDSIGNRLLRPICFVLFQRVQIVEPFDEQQVRDLFHHFQRIGDPAGPKCVPEPVDFAAYLACQHVAFPLAVTGELLFRFSA